MKYAMLSMLIPRELEAFFANNSKHTMQDAANAHQWNIYRGLCYNLHQDIRLINVLPVGSYPQYYRYPFIKRSTFDPAGENIGFCNVKLIREFCKERKVYKSLLKWCRSCDEEKTLFVYTICAPFVRAAAKIKRKFPSLHICAIVADLPNMSNLSSKESVLHKLYVRMRTKISYDSLNSIDSFVLLTKYMADYMKISQPFCVMEGIISPDDAPIDDRHDDGIKRIVYTGTLHRRFGVLHLLQAFGNIEDPSARLVICGIGDSEEEILKAAKEDPRIDFRGQQSRDDVLKLQREATVLVNPRQNKESFTKYSFPSKTLEYLGSGVPVIAYKLDGIPDEYDKYLLYPKNDTVDALSEVLSMVCDMDDEKREKHGYSGREYVLDNKNLYVQTKRILDFLSSLQ